MTYAAAFNTASTVLATTTELACCTTPTVIVPGGVYQGMSIRGNVNAAMGTAGTTGIIRVRQGSGTAGTVVGVPVTITTTALSLYNFPINVVDTTAAGAATYTITFAQGGASGSDGTVKYSEIEIDPVTSY